MEHIVSQIPGWIVTAITGFVGIGVGYGFLKAEIKELKEFKNEYKEKVNQLSVSMLEKGDCIMYRNQCKDDLADKLSDIKIAITTNREVVVTQFNDVIAFMGYVKGKMEEYNKK